MLTGGRYASTRSPSEALEPRRGPTRYRAPRERETPRLFGGIMRFLSGLLTLCFMALTAFFGLVVYLNHNVEQPGPLANAIIFVVPRGEGVNEIANRLEKEGVISSALTFKMQHAGERIFATFSKSTKPVEIKAGEYEFKKEASIRNVLDTMAEGKSVLYKITIPEGLTSQQIVNRLLADQSLAGSVDVMPPEGTLLPDTYRFSRSMSRQDLIERLQSEHRKFLTAAWEARQKELPLKSIDEALVLASIVEKETGRNDERQRVAAVFVNRLRRGMRLQSDPTIIYGIVGGQGPLGRAIYRSDIDQKTPFNTYQIDGLPPGPICNPGRASIEAVLNPAQTSDLYFVADGSGGHAFAPSLKEHNANVANWRKIEKEARARQAPGNSSRPVPALSGTGAAQADVEEQTSATPVPGAAAQSPAAPSAGKAGAPSAQPKSATGAKPAAKPAAPPQQATPDPNAVPLPTRKPKS